MKCSINLLSQVTILFQNVLLPGCCLSYRVLNLTNQLITLPLSVVSTLRGLRTVTKIAHIATCHITHRLYIQQSVELPYLQSYANRTTVFYCYGKFQFLNSQEHGLLMKNYGVFRNYQDSITAKCGEVGSIKIFNIKF